MIHTNYPKLYPWQTTGHKSTIPGSGLKTSFTRFRPICSLSFNRNCIAAGPSIVGSALKAALIPLVAHCQDGMEKAQRKPWRFQGFRSNHCFFHGKSNHCFNLTHHVSYIYAYNIVFEHGPSCWMAHYFNTTCCFEIQHLQGFLDGWLRGARVVRKTWIDSGHMRHMFQRLTVTVWKTTMRSSL